MSLKMLISTDHPEECRAVILENGKIEGIIVEHSTRELLKGNVYVGVITRVEPAIEAAFVDFGGKKFGFLPFKDVQRESYLQTGERKAKLRIQDVLVKGQKIPVQVVKEERDSKGPTLTNYITIPGRFLVLMHGNVSGGVSRKIEDEEERKKMKEIIADLQIPENMGVIIRTAGMGRSKAELQKDLQMLLKIWDTIGEMSSQNVPPPFLVYQVPDMVVRTVRDHYTTETSEIIVDNLQSYRTLKDFFKLVMPRMANRVKLYSESKPLFSHYNIESQIESIYNRRVNLPSGGSLVLDVGEAMVAIDVNSGKTTNASELEETALRTNLEAAEEIARQLRLRDLGGLIVIDFIDMQQKKNNALVEKQLKNAFKKDKARINISRISKFGLLEMSRQRLSPPVREGAFDRCAFCEGSGLIKSASSMTLGVLRKIQEYIAAKNVKILSVEVSTDVANYLLNHKMRFLLNLQEKQDVKIVFNSKLSLRFENFTYTVLERKREDEKTQETRLKETSRAPVIDETSDIDDVDDVLNLSEENGEAEAVVVEETSQPQEALAESAALAAGEQKAESKEPHRDSRGHRGRNFSRRPQQGRKPMQSRGRRRRPPRNDPRRQRHFRGNATPNAEGGSISPTDAGQTTSTVPSTHVNEAPRESRPVINNEPPVITFAEKPSQDG